MKNNESYKMKCLSVNNYAKGVSKLDSLLVFTDDFYPDEEALISLTKKEKNYTFGRIEKFITKSKYRIDRVCDHENSGTCPFNDIDYNYELELKKQMVKSNIERALKIELPDFKVESGDIIDGYRNKVTVFYKRDKSGIYYGTFKEGTNTLVKINSCVQISNDIKMILDELSLLFKKYNIDIVDYIRKQGILKGVSIRKSIYTGKFSVMILSRKMDKSFNNIANDLSKTFKDITGISVIENTSFDTFIYSGKETMLYGVSYIDEKILDVVFKVDNLAFLQVNTSCASKLYEKAIKFADLKKNEVVLDLYSGCGGISLNAAKYISEVIGVETVESAVISAKENAKYNKITNASFYKADALDFKSIIKDKHIDTVFVDPPRSGMEKPVVDSLLDGNYKKIVYVSCDSYTMARDLKLLSDKYEIKDIECFNMFPRTKHVESIVGLYLKEENNKKQ